jgi:hypothetical protein
MANMPSEESAEGRIVRYIIKGEEYEKESEDPNGLWIMRNVRTGEIRRIDSSSIGPGKFVQIEEHVESIKKGMQGQQRKMEVVQEEPDISPDI